MISNILKLEVLPSSFEHFISASNKFIIFQQLHQRSQLLETRTILLLFTSTLLFIINAEYNMN